MIGNKEIYIDQYCFEEFIKESLIRKKVSELAKLISEDYQGKTPIFICILDGAFIFAADLIREVTIPNEIHFVKLRSYHGLQSEGLLDVRLPIEFEVTGRDVIVVEDIIDSGNTLAQFIEMVRKKNPNSLKLATLLSKPEARKFSVKVEYVGFEIPNDFVIGYGLDYDGRGRDLSSIYRLNSNEK